MIAAVVALVLVYWALVGWAYVIFSRRDYGPSLVSWVACMVIFVAAVSILSGEI